MATVKEGTIETVQYDINRSMEDNLGLFIGKRLTVILVSGQSLSGTVKEVKNNLLHLEKLADKNYYDALIAVSTISAIEAQVRGF